MLRLLGGLKEYLKWQPLVTDSAIFRLHNLFTTAVLLAFSLIVTATQYVGQPIQCITGGGLPTHPINTFCWITSTFTMPDEFHRRVGLEVAHPGIGNDYNDEGAKKYYNYYQWVCFVLFFQAMLCYTPKWLWDAWEGGLINTLVMGLNNPILPDEEKSKKKKILVDYLRTHVNRHSYYVLRYWFCEFLCLINILLQMYMMNKFFDGEFMSYGLRVLSFSETAQEDRVDPMLYIFPRVTKCLFHKFGPSGSLQKHDSLCVLPLNIVNEKTYIFLWFWYMILSFLLLGLLIYRTVMIVCETLRPRLLRARNRMIPIEVAEAVCRKVSLGDWWLLYMLGSNIDPLIYRDVMSELAKKIDSRSHSH